MTKNTAAPVRLIVVQGKQIKPILQVTPKQHRALYGRPVVRQVDYISGK